MLIFVILPRKDAALAQVSLPPRSIFCFFTTFSLASTPVYDKEVKSRNGGDTFIMKFLKVAYSTGVELNCATSITIFSSRP